MIQQRNLWEMLLKFSTTISTALKILRLIWTSQTLPTRHLSWELRCSATANLKTLGWGDLLLDRSLVSTTDRASRAINRTQLPPRRSDNTTTYQMDAARLCRLPWGLKLWVVIEEVSAKAWSWTEALWQTIKRCRKWRDHISWVLIRATKVMGTVALGLIASATILVKPFQLEPWVRYKITITWKLIMATKSTKTNRPIIL